MDDFKEIKKCTDDEKKIIIDALVQFNAAQVPFTHPSHVDLSYSVKNQQGVVIGGILARIYCWGVVFVDILWINDHYRGQGLGTTLLNKVEEDAKAQQCHLIHLDTFDFQAKDFYEKNGFEIYGVLDNCPPNHKRYYMKKILQA